MVILSEPAYYSVLRLTNKLPKHLGFSKAQHRFLSSIKVSMKCFELNSTYNIRKRAMLGGMTFTQYPNLS
jgi:hypothetical protein